MALASDADTEGRLNKNGPSNMMAAWQGSAIRKKKETTQTNAQISETCSTPLPRDS
jgi:hypothetical protein